MSKFIELTSIEAGVETFICINISTISYLTVNKHEQTVIHLTSANRLYFIVKEDYEVVKKLITN